jgi:MoaA/NifB/PqqE/SkfB family radical SAM enzyme
MEQIKNPAKENALMLDYPQWKFPASICLTITYRCNLRCKHCLYHSEAGKKIISKLAQKEIPTNEWLKIVEFSNPYILTYELTGGEVFLQRKKLFPIIEKIHLAGRAKWELTTNGLLVTHDDLQKLTEFRSSCAAVRISFGGGVAPTHNFLRGDDTFEPTVDILRLFSDFKFPVYPILNIHSRTTHEDIEQFTNLAVKYSKRAGIGLIFPEGAAISNCQTIMPPLNQALELYEEGYKQLIKKGRSKHIPPAGYGCFGKNPKSRPAFCNSLESSRGVEISPTGMLRACTAIPTNNVHWSSLFGGKHREIITAYIKQDRGADCDICLECSHRNLCVKCFRNVQHFGSAAEPMPECVLFPENLGVPLEHWRPYEDRLKNIFYWDSQETVEKYDWAQYRFKKGTKMSYFPQSPIILINDHLQRTELKLEQVHPLMVMILLLLERRQILEYELKVFLGSVTSPELKKELQDDIKQLQDLGYIELERVHLEN